MFLSVTMRKELFAGLVLCSMIFFMEGEDEPQKFLFSYHCITFCGLENAQKQPVVSVLKKNCFSKYCKIYRKPLVPEPFLIKLGLQKDSGDSVFLWIFRNMYKIHFLQNTSGRLLRRLEKSSWLLVEDIFQPCKFLILIDSILMGLAMECRNFIFKPFTKERRNSLEFSGICYDMLFMFVIVGKVVNLLLPFATYMNSFYVLFVSFWPCMK